MIFLFTISRLSTLFVFPDHKSYRPFNKLLDFLFRVNVVEDASTVEMCGALKNIVACAAGFVQGLKLGDNTKSAVIRIGLMEMMKYAKEFGDNAKLETFLESCGVADLVTTCYGGRNARIGREFVLQRKSVEQLEIELLNGKYFSIFALRIPE